MKIVRYSLENYLKLPSDKLKHFSCILVIPDQCNKIHWKHLIKNVLLLGFKSIFVHQESVLASYAIGQQQAVIVDIGSSKVQVSCVDEGIVLQKTLIKKHIQPPLAQNQLNLLASLL